MSKRPGITAAYVELPDEFHHEVKQAVARRKTTFREAVKQGLRWWLDSTKVPEQPQPPTGVSTVESSEPEHISSSSTNALSVLVKRYGLEPVERLLDALVAMEDLRAIAHAPKEDELFRFERQDNEETRGKVSENPGDSRKDAR